jgi:hypothetical protein
MNKLSKTDRIINRILEVENFQNVACFCADFAEFVQELAEWGVDGCAKVDFDDADLDIAKLDRFIKAENGYIREVA